MAQARNATLIPAAAINRIGWALLLFATIFTAVALALPVFAGPGDLAGADPLAGGLGLESHRASEGTDIVLVMSFTNLVLFLSLLPGAFFLPARIAVTSPNPHATRRILRWALLEGAALFGGVVLLLAGINGVVPANPLYYLNLVPYAAFVYFLVGDLVNTPDPRDPPFNR